MIQKHQTFREYRKPFPALHPQNSSQHVRACATRDGAIWSQKKVLQYHGDSPNTIKRRALMVSVLDCGSWPKTITDLSMRFWGINLTNSVVIPLSLVLRCIIFSWILIFRRIPKVTAFVTFEFSRQKEPLISGSCYFWMVEKRLYGSSRPFKQSGRVWSN